MSIAPGYGNASELQAQVFDLQHQNEGLRAENARLREALKPFAVFGRWGSRDVEVAAARAALGGQEHDIAL